MMTRNRILLFVSIFVLGFLACLLLEKTVFLKQKNSQECSKNYPFVYSGIDCEKVDEVANQVDDLKENVNKIIDNEKKEGNIIRASVFYRNMNSKRWFGINDLEEYYPASLIKLPVAIAYFKVAELQPDIFNEKLQIPTEGEDPENNDQYYKPQNPLVPGNTYSIKEMVDHMLIYSDNAPYSILFDTIKTINNQVFSDLGVYVPSAEKGGDWSVTSRNFAYIFRTLYNASYLNIKYANEVLDLLSRSQFKQGIVSGIPGDVKVAHKFGEATAMNNETEIHSRILNDCGIVYKPENPYILCVMTEGQDFAKQEKVIQKISKEAYNAI